QEAELNQQQVKEILQDLNLPPELLDEALIQVRRKQALQVQERRHKLIGLGVAAAVIMSIGLTVFFHQQKSYLLANVSAQQDKITLKSNNENIKNISRQANSELVYRVTLKDAPIGKKLNLSCDWIDPNGQVVKQNNYQTSEIKTSVWDTFCRYAINPTTPVGNWQVQMFLEGRKISEATFVVQ
ncbi:MAG: DUF3859 domain-containing protein, partial [Dolichospermum sp.]